MRRDVALLKKTLRAAFAWMLAAALMVSAFPVSAAAKGGFEDVESGAWYYGAVQWAVENGITNGTSAGKFSPGDSCTRGQIVTFLYRAMGGGTVSGSNPFSDVSPKDYFYSPVLWAVGENITEGTAADSFSPAGGCTRAQAVTFLWRAAGSPAPGGLSGFSDVPAGAYYADAVAWAVENGITSGVSKTEFKPNDSCTRGQIVTFLHRFSGGGETAPTPALSFWNRVFPVPSRSEINAYANPDYCRSPYIAGWLSIPDGLCYTEYSVDFKADFAPVGTYCCISNWKLDLSDLKKTHTNVRTEYAGVQGYAGFQNTDGDKGRATIMSFWDIYATDPGGKDITIRAKLIYPETDGDDSFGGEGTGAHRIVSYDWEDGHWYRMLLQCGKNSATGNTTVEQWVCDLETGTWTKLCVYDTGLKKTSFIGSTAFFLENYLAYAAGEVRTMELKNARYRQASDGRWVNIDSAYMSSQGGKPKYEGSYNFGSEGGSFWAITSGVGGDWYNNGKGRSAAWIYVNNTASGSPY